LLEIVPDSGSTIGVKTPKKSRQNNNNCDRQRFEGGLVSMSPPSYYRMPEIFLATLAQAAFTLITRLNLPDVFKSCSKR